MILFVKLFLLLCIFCGVLGYWAMTEGIVLVQENDFVVPEEDRIPLGTFQRNYDSRAKKVYDQSKKSYFYTQFMDVASPMTNGFHDILPKHNRWENGKIVMGESYQERNEHELKVTKDRIESNKN